MKVSSERVILDTHNAHEHGHGIGDHLYVHKHSLIHDLPAQVKTVAAIVFIAIFELFLDHLNWAENFKFSQPIIAICMWVACLPSMVLAWQLPTEHSIPEEAK